VGTWIRSAEMMDGWISEMTGWGGAQGEGEGRFSVALKKDDVEDF